MWNRRYYYREKIKKGAVEFLKFRKGSLLGAYHNIIAVYCNRICKWSKDCNCIESG